MKKLLLLSIFSSLIISCGDDLVTPTLTLDQKNISYLPNGGETEIKINTNISDWYYSIQNEDNDWVRGEKTTAGLKLKISPHLNNNDNRTSIVRVYAGNEMQAITINQTSANNALSVNTQAFTVSAAGETIEFTINSIIDYTVNLADNLEWIRLLEKENIDSQQTKYKYVVDQYRNMQEARTAKITVVGNGDYSIIEREITINQERYIPNHIPTGIVSAETSSSQNESTKTLVK